MKTDEKDLLLNIDINLRKIEQNTGHTCLIVKIYAIIHAVLILWILVPIAAEYYSTMV